MKGYRFFIEFSTKTAKNKATVKSLTESYNADPHVEVEGCKGTIVAVVLKDDGAEESYISQGNIIFEAVVGVSDRPNSPVCYASVGWDYLREVCKRVPERLARRVHHELFRYLEK